MIPRQLPPTVVDFTGRAELLDDLVQTLTTAASRPAATMVALTGMGGIGKTALAVHAGHLAAAAFPDGHLYLNFRGYGPGSPLAASDALAQVLRSLGVSNGSIPAGLDEAASLYRSVTSGKRILLVLDNAADADQVLPLLPGSGGSAVVLTARRSMTALAGFRQLSISALRDTEAVSLLEKLVGRTRIKQERAASEQLAGLTGGLPLALRLVGARLATRPGWRLAALVDQLRDEQRRLDEFGRDQSGVRASIAGSVEYLSTSDDLNRRAAAALELLGLPDGQDLSTVVAAQLVDDSPARTELMLEKLADLHLLESTAPDRYRLHDLIRVYARERLQASSSEEQRTAALTRVLELYAGVAWRSHAMSHTESHRLQLARTSDAPGPRFADQRASLQWLDEELPNIVERFRQAARSQQLRGPLLAELALAMFGYHECRERWSEMRLLVREGADIALEHGMTQLAAWLEHDLAIPEGEVGNFDLAFDQLCRSLALFESAGDRLGQARCCSSLSRVCERLGRIDAAIEWGRKALAISEALGDVSIQGISHLALGILYHRIGEHELADAAFQQSVAMAEASGNQRSLAKRYQMAGDAYLAGKAYEEAGTWLASAYEAYGQIGDSNGQAECLVGMAAVSRAADDSEAAIRHLTTGLPLARSFRNRHREGEILADLGRLSMAAGDRTEAVAYWTQAAEALRGISVSKEATVRSLIAEASAGTES